MLPPGYRRRPPPGSLDVLHRRRRQTSSTWSSKRDDRDGVVGSRRLGEQREQLLTSPSRLRMSMLPERSTTRVRLTDGRSSAASVRARHRDPDHLGAVVELGRQRRSPCGAARSASVGAGSPYGSALTHSSDAHRLRRAAGALRRRRPGDAVGAVVDVEREGRLGRRRPCPRSHSCRRRRRCCPRAARAPGTSWAVVAGAPALATVGRRPRRPPLVVVVVVCGSASSGRQRRRRTGDEPRGQREQDGRGQRASAASGGVMAARRAFTDARSSTSAVATRSCPG